MAEKLNILQDLVEGLDHQAQLLDFVVGIDSPPANTAFDGTEPTG